MKTDNKGLFQYSLQSLSQYWYVFDRVSLDLHNDENPIKNNIMTDWEKKCVQDRKPIYYVENLKKYYKIYAYILHDKDKLETGETKKPHYHYIITTGKNPERIKTLSKTTEIPINYIERLQQR